MMQTGLLLSSNSPPTDIIRQGQLAEALGYDFLWYPDEKFYRYVYIGLTLLATNTSRVHIGTCVTDPYSRHPMLTAVAIASLEEIAPHRTILGLGAGGRGFAEMGISRDKPATALRDVIHIIRSLLNKETVSYKGDVIQVTGGRLDFPSPGNIPIVIGAGHGPMILRMAGEIADGVMIHSYATPPGLLFVKDLVMEGLTRGNRQRQAFQLISRLDFSISENRDEARRAVKPKILSALRASYPELTYIKPYPNLKITDDLRKIIETTRSDPEAKRHYYNPDHIDKFISDEFVTHLALAGTASDVADQVRAIARLGFDQITIKPVPFVGASTDQLIERFTREVMTKVEIPGSKNV